MHDIHINDSWLLEEESTFISWILELIINIKIFLYDLLFICLSPGLTFSIVHFINIQLNLLVGKLLNLLLIFDSTISKVQ